MEIQMEKIGCVRANILVLYEDAQSAIKTNIAKSKCTLHYIKKQV